MKLEAFGKVLIVLGLIASVVEYVMQLCLPAVGPMGGCHYMWSPDGVIPLYPAIVLVIGLILFLYAKYAKKV